MKTINLGWGYKARVLKNGDIHSKDKHSIYWSYARKVEAREDGMAFVGPAGKFYKQYEAERDFFLAMKKQAELEFGRPY